jgi:Putative MetA-pathway of phenol degradation
MKRTLLLLLAAPALAKEPPAAALREMSTDRPDTTESAFTVPRGMWQFEMETVSISRDAGVQSEDWGSINIKYGLTGSMDLQLVTPAWHSEPHLDGWSDTEIRLKCSLCGQNDAAPVAVALMPYIKLPTASHGLGNNNVEGGVIVPIAFKDTPFACMVQTDIIRDEDDDSYTGAFTFTATAGTEFTARLSGFIEGVATLPLDGDAETYLNGGLVYELRRNWFLDAGVNVGLNDAAEDTRFFTGMSFRF